MSKKEDLKKAKRVALLIAWLKMHGFKNINKLGQLGVAELVHLKKMIQQKRKSSENFSQNDNQLWQLIQIEKNISQQNWMMIKQNERLIAQNDEILGYMKKLRVIHRKHPNK